MHELIIGRTLSGKTTLAKKKSRAIQRNGRGVIVLDIFEGKDWIEFDHLCYVTSDKEKFLKAVWDSNDCAIFVDEAGEAAGKYDDVMNTLATRGRHWGHKCYFITQRGKQLSTTIRTQCSCVCIFKQSLQDTKDLANEFVEPMINEAHSLNDGEFICVRHGHKAVKLNAFKL